MAFFFSLAVECGTEAAATECADHFSQPADGDADVPVHVSVRRSSQDGAWWAVVVPVRESSSGVVSEAVAASLTAAGRTLLNRLRTAPPFRFAVIGVEAYEAISIDELDAELGADPTLPDRFHGLVVSDDVRAMLGERAPLEPFAPGYSSIPYRGEKFRANT